MKFPRISGFDPQAETYTVQVQLDADDLYTMMGVEQPHGCTREQVERLLEGLLLIGHASVLVHELNGKYGTPKEHLQ